jgi:2',3'-cyclic-nucleotide 2'-phosphodiesterase/3'-nucleotidase
MSQRRRIGRSEVPLHTYFSTIAPCAATQLISDAQRAAARALLRCTDDVNRLPLLSAVAPMRSGGRAGPDQFTDIPAGESCCGMSRTSTCYPNMLPVLRLRGSRPDTLAGTRGLDVQPHRPGTRSNRCIDHDSPDTISTGSTA